MSQFNQEMCLPPFNVSPKKSSIISGSVIAALIVTIVIVGLFVPTPFPIGGKDCCTKVTYSFDPNFKVYYVNSSLEESDSNFITNDSVSGYEVFELSLMFYKITYEFKELILEGINNESFSNASEFAKYLEGKDIYGDMGFEARFWTDFEYFMNSSLDDDEIGDLIGSSKTFSLGDPSIEISLDIELYNGTSKEIYYFSPEWILEIESEEDLLFDGFGDEEDFSCGEYEINFVSAYVDPGDSEYIKMVAEFDGSSRVYYNASSFGP